MISFFFLPFRIGQLVDSRQSERGVWGGWDRERSRMQDSNSLRLKRNGAKCQRAIHKDISNNLLK